MNGKITDFFKSHMGTKMAVIIVIVGAIFGSTLGLHTRILYDADVPPEAITFFRALVTVVLLLIILLIIDRKLFRIRKEHIMIFILLGLSKAFMDYTLVGAQNHLTMGFAVALQMTAPVFVVILSYLIYKRKISMMCAIGIIICMIGVIFYSDVIFDFGSLSFEGHVVGLCSGLTTAVFLMVSKSLLEKGYNPLTIVFYAFLAALVIIIPVADVPNSISLVTNNSMWPIVISMGFFCTLIPFVFLAIGQKYLDTVTVTILNTFEIVSAAAIGAVFFQEYDNLLSIIGIVLIIVSIVVIAKADSGNVSNESASEKKPSG